jgi:hypothetical protein
MWGKAQAGTKPEHWHLLSSDDAQAYLQLSTIFHASLTKTHNGQRLDTFNERLKKIRTFIEREGGESWRRSLVCGVFFLPDGFMLHIRQLQILMGKSRSSINGSFQQMGYSPRSQFHRFDNAYFPGVPHQHMIGQLKNWTMRKKIESEQLTISMASEQPEAVTVEQRESQNVHNFPCPVKWRYKFWDTIRSRGRDSEG